MGLVGRDTELKVVGSAVGVAAAGGFRLAVVSGEPGIGKTALLGAAAARAEDEGLRVISARAVTQERDVPFALAATLLGDDDAIGAASDTAADRFRHHRALSARLDELAGGEPIALIADDVQWADEGSFEWLVHLIRRPPRAPAVLLLGARPGAAALELVAAAREDGDLVPLGPLGHDDAALLAGDGEHAERIVAEAGGNPLFVRELARAAERAGGALPPTIAAAVQQEVADLPEAARELIGAAAVVGDPFDDAIAAAVAGGDPAAAALDALVAADLVRPESGRRRFAFRHPLVRRAVYDAIPAARRLDLHRAAAAELAARGAALAERAPHVERSASTGDRDAADLLDRAAQEVVSRAPAIAAGFWGSALDLLATPDPDLLSRRARALAAAGRSEEALKAFDDAGHEPADAALAAQIERSLGHTAAARARLLAAVDRVEGSDRARLELELATTAFIAGDLDGARRHLRAVIEAWPSGDEAARTLHGALDVFAGLLEGRSTPEELAPFEQRALQLPPGNDEATGWLGVLAFQAERYVPATRLLERAISGAASDTGHLVIPHRATRAVALYLDLRPRAALDEAEMAEETARLHGATVQAGWAASTRAMALDLLGRRREAQAAAAASQADLEDAEPGILASVATALDASILRTHDPERLITEVRERVGPLLLRVSLLIGPLVTAAIATNRLDEARGWLDELEGQATHFNLRAGTARVARARADLLLAAGDAEAACGSAERAVAITGEADLKLDGLHARLTLGRALAAAGERARAQEALEGALADAGRAEAETLVGEAARALRAAGLRTTARAIRATTGGAGELTPREDAIAGLVARGRSNKEVASELFLSAKTVENNLSRIYAKLGVRSRAELAAALQGGRGGSPSSRSG